MRTNLSKIRKNKINIYPEILDELIIQYNISTNSISDEIQNKVKLVLTELEGKRYILDGSVGNFELVKNLKLSEGVIEFTHSLAIRYNTDIANILREVGQDIVTMDYLITSQKKSNN